MPWTCPYCSNENSDDSNFCTRCGAKRPEVQQPPAQQTPQTVQPSSVSQQPTEPQTPVQPPQESVQTTSQIQQPPEVQQSTQVTPQTTTIGKYYIVFITTPASALNKSKVPLDFDVFEHISIGRSPENVIVVPDPEVSRRHAIISLENGKLYIEDLNSTNGTYIYDGKLFNPIKGKMEIQAGSLIKLGNNTIIKIVTE